MEQTIKIIAEPQADADQCKFVLEKPLIQEGGSYRFSSKEEAKGSKIAEVLLDIPQIASVFVSANSILVTKKSTEDWRAIGKDIGAAIRTAVASGETLISEKIKSFLPDEEEIKTKVQEILEKQINPAVASHGGVIELLGVRKNDIFIRMSGGCQGCGMASATLKHGVEKSFRDAIPHLGAVYDTTDHAAGTNPYFAG